MIGLSTGVSDNRVVPAGDVLAIIKAGQSAEFDDCIIVGDLNLSVLTIERPVHFNHTTFQDSVDFKSTIFNSPADFGFSTFNSPAVFWLSTFNSTANFGFSTFNSTADFWSSTFNSSTNFERSTFNDNTYFVSSTFNSNTSFVSSTFNHLANFERSTFNGNTYFVSLTFNGDTSFVSSTFNRLDNFERSTFNGNTSFVSSTFNRLADFESSTFNGDTNFGFSTINSYADFEFSTFNSSTNFERSTFKDDTDFWLSTFNSSANFFKDTFDSEANFDDVVFKGNVIFNSCQFKEDAIFENTTFQSTLSLAKTRYDKLYIRWYKIYGGLIYDEAVYMSLMKNFKDLGYFEDYDSCYFQYRKEHRGQPWPLVGGLNEPVEKCIDFFLELFYGYGTRPFNAVYFSIAIIGVFGLFWRAIGVGGLGDVTGVDDKNWKKPSGIFDVLSFSTTIFLSGTKLFIDPPVIPKIKGRSSIVKKAFIVERILGAFFSILFILAISGTMVR